MDMAKKSKNAKGKDSWKGFHVRQVAQLHGYAVFDDGKHFTPYMTWRIKEAMETLAMLHDAGHHDAFMCHATVFVHAEGQPFKAPKRKAVK